MTRAAQLRSSIEDALARRIPAALTPQLKAAPPMQPTGIAELDEALGGGLPIGAITEIVGAPGSSGRTTCAQSFVARVLAQGQVGTWIDVSDTLDPESAAANGVDLSRLLWVRCSGTDGGPTSTEGLRPGRPVAAPAPAAPVMGGGGSPHPRSEVRGLPEALDTLFTGAAPAQPDAFNRFTPPRRARGVGTPGMPNRDLAAAAREPGPRAMDRQEQVPTDRLPARRGAYLLAQRTRTSVAAIPAKRSDLVAERRAGQAALFARPTLRVVAPGQPHTPARFQAPNRAKPWSRLDQALRATDLVLQAGGFSTVVLDLGNIPPEFVSRIPLATWFRFRTAAERTRAAILLLTQHPCAQSSAEVVLRTHLAAPEPGTVLSALPCTVELVRQRFRPAAATNVLPLRKPPARAHATGWRARAMWAGGR